MDNANQLTPAEDERLAILAEECAEVVHIVCKIMRHGYNSFHPDNPSISNRVLLQRELGNVQRAVDMMGNAGDINQCAIDLEVERGSISKVYLHHQPEPTAAPVLARTRLEVALRDILTIDARQFISAGDAVSQSDRHLQHIHALVRMVLGEERK